MLEENGRLKWVPTRRHRRLLFFALYFCEGAPIGFIWWSLPTILRSEGIPVTTISSLTAMLVIPWTFKFLWAPIVDRYRTRGWSLKRWIILSQCVMGLSLVPLLVLDITTNLWVLFFTLLVHALSAATQDVAVDALAITLVPAGELGSINGWMQAGMLTGRAIFGGGSLMLLQYAGQTFTIALLIGVVWGVTATFVLIAMPGESTSPGQLNRAGAASVLERVREMIRLRSTWVTLLFAVVSGAAFEAVGSLVGPYLVDRGFTQMQIGMFLGIPTVVAMIGGALLGGFLSDRVGKNRMLGISLAILVCVVFVLAGSDYLGGTAGSPIHVILLTILYLCIGLFTASSYAFFMATTDRALSATQFSTYMGATNACEAWSSFAAGRLVAPIGYAGSFAVMATVSLLSVGLLRYLPKADTE